MRRNDWSGRGSSYDRNLFAFGVKYSDADRRRGENIKVAVERAANFPLTGADVRKVAAAGHLLFVDLRRDSPNGGG